jgi:hypothetical protein
MHIGCAGERTAYAGTRLVRGGPVAGSVGHKVGPDTRNSSVMKLVGNPGIVGIRKGTDLEDPANLSERHIYARGLPESERSRQTKGAFRVW